MNEQIAQANPEVGGEIETQQDRFAVASQKKQSLPISLVASAVVAAALSSAAFARAGDTACSRVQHLSVRFDRLDRFVDRLFPAVCHADCALRRAIHGRR